MTYMIDLDVKDRFYLEDHFKQYLRDQKEQFGFGLLGSVVYARTYSRIMSDGRQERWSDTVIRVVEGVFTIRKWWYLRNGLKWDNEKWNSLAQDMAASIFRMEMLPPGRGLWSGGSEWMYEKGSAALYNCAYVENRHLSEDAAWTMDMLMCGTGVGHNTQFFAGDKFHLPSLDANDHYVIPDSREGWVESVRRLIQSYETGGPTVTFDYTLIRPAGALIKGFGGVASGSGPLALLHDQLRQVLAAYVDGLIGKTRLQVDIHNMIGACVVAGNVRRSAEISLGSPRDTEFTNLKNYGTEDSPGPAWDRRKFGGLSNNSVVMQDYEDFSSLSEISQRIRDNGEPGILNLLNIQRYGRYGEKREDKATGANPCVTGDTRILTRDGYKEIQSLLDTQVDVWNGFEWSEVTPKVTGKDQEILGITFSDGSYLKTTPYHLFKISEKYRAKAPKDVSAKDLQVGDKLWKYTMPTVPFGEDSPVAYSQGFYSGDGFVNHSGYGPNTWLYGKKKALSVHLPGEVYGNPTEQRVGFRLLLHSEDKTFVPFNWSIRSRLDWFAGLLDSDGTVTKDGNLQIASVNLAFLQDVRLMLTTLGVQAKISVMHEERTASMPNGHGGTAEYDCQTVYRMTTAVQDTLHLRSIGLSPNLVELSSYDTTRNAARFVTVSRVDRLGSEALVYCFTEPKNHTGTFEGVVTGQCSEIPLEDAEVCNLVEVFPSKCLNSSGTFSAEVFYRALRLATLYSSTVSLLPTHNARTNEVVSRNRRIGVSLSGIAQWTTSEGWSRCITYMNRGYDVVLETNKRLNAEAGVPQAVRVTTLKPSGSISLVAGVSSGMHLPPFSRYIRRVRIGENTPLVPLLIEAGVPHEPDVVSDGTLVFEFPIDLGKVKGQKDVSIWEKAQTVVLLQRFWADNMVSNTINFDPESEGHMVESVIAHMLPFTKSMSFMPTWDFGSMYAQVPEEQITLDEVNRRKREIREIDWEKFSGSDGEDSKFCTTDSCEWEPPANA